MNVLVTGHGHDRDVVDASRRAVRYDVLVLLTTRPGDLADLRANEELAGVRVEVREVDGHDMTACLAAACAAIDAHARDEVRVHVAGGPNLVANALLLAAFQKGVDAFYCHAREGEAWKTTSLPVAAKVALVDRFTATERAVLLALPATGETPLAALDVLPLPTVKDVLLRLRSRGLVTADHLRAALTPTGAYYRAHFG